MRALPLREQWYLFTVIFLRELTVYKKRLPNLMFNFYVIQVLIFTTIQGYIKPLMYFGENPGRAGTVLFLGSIVMISIHRSFDFGMALFYDINTQKVIHYQAQSTPFYLVYLARLIFSILGTWVLLLPMYPLSKLILGDFFYTAKANWLIYGFVLLCSVAVITSYAFLSLSIVTTLQGVTALRTRGNEFLMWFGGFNAPWWAMHQSGAHWGYIALANPLIYATEAIRQSITPGKEFFPFYVTIPVMMSITVVFATICYLVLRYRLLKTENYVPRA